MNYLAVKDLKAPKLVREMLAEYGTALVSNNGKPMAMLVDLLEGENPEALSEAIRACAVFAPFAPYSGEHALPDPDDAIFVEAALGLHVPIVTGNHKHFPARAIGDMPVLSPAAFLAQLVAHE